MQISHKSSSKPVAEDVGVERLVTRGEAHNGKTKRTKRTQATDLGDDHEKSGNKKNKIKATCEHHNCVFIAMLTDNRTWSGAGQTALNS
jgi:hypothetical protein